MPLTTAKIRPPTTWNTAVTSTTTQSNQIVDKATEGKAQGARIWIKADTKLHIIFGGSATGAATTSMGYLTADQDYVFDLSADTTYFSHIQPAASSAGKVFWAFVD